MALLFRYSVGVGSALAVVLVIAVITLSQSDTVVPELFAEVTIDANEPANLEYRFDFPERPNGVNLSIVPSFVSERPLRHDWEMVKGGIPQFQVFMPDSVGINGSYDLDVVLSAVTVITSVVESGGQKIPLNEDGDMKIAYIVEPGCVRISIDMKSEKRPFSSVAAFWSGAPGEDYIGIFPTEVAPENRAGD